MRLGVASCCEKYIFSETSPAMQQKVLVLKTLCATISQILQRNEMLINEKELPLVAMDSMNKTHLEDVIIINDLFDQILSYEREANEQNKKNVVEKYQLWINHTVEHFSGEEKMMTEKRFPAYAFHKGEHDRILSLMSKHLENFEQTCDTKELKQYFIEELPIWLENHIKSMDTVTAIFLKTGLSPCSMR